MSWFTKKNPSATEKQRIYLDYAAATPMTTAAKAAMLEYLDTDFGNPGGIHQEGVVAKRAVEASRIMVARTLGVQETGVVFTSGGTESNNLAIRGVVESIRLSGRSYESMTVLSTKLEHPATLKTLEHLLTLGVQVRYLPVKDDGQLILHELPKYLDASVVLVTLAYVNSEVGVVTDCRAVRRMLDDAESQYQTTILLHIDGAQAPLWLPCGLERIGADLLSLDGGKCGGGKGIGALVTKRSIQYTAITYGGGQERGLRPGTEPVAQIAAFALALKEVQDQYETRCQSVAAIRNYFWQEIKKHLPSAVLNGPDINEYRVANNIHISIPGIDAEFAVITLDAAGIAASTKSACSSKGGGASPVVLAMTGDEARATSTLRFTLGPETTKEDIDKTVQVLATHVHHSLSH